MNIVKATSIPDAESKIRPFLRDVEPLFHRKPVIYADVGAYTGAVFREIFQSDLKPVRAYLIEPNPASFARLRETVQALDADQVATCYNLALGAAAGTLRLRARHDMTQVVAGESDGAAEAAGDFEIPARSLDALAGEFVAPHVSLLKIDVEGYETEVLAGAAGLLAAQAIDMIYIEAGLDPENRQQTFYREIEDGLRVHGYRLFRIYEQRHEWPRDNPALRRANMAFISSSFADGNPLRLSKELFALRREYDDLLRRRVEESRTIEALRAETAIQAAQVGTLEAKIGERHREIEARDAERVANDARAAEAKARIDAETKARIDAETEARAEAERRLAEEIERKESELQTAAARSAREAKKIASLGRQVAETNKRFADLKGQGEGLKSYARTLEARYLAILESRSWRLLEPGRRIIRRLTGKRSPAPFAPRFLETAATSLSRAGQAASALPKLSQTDARKTAQRLVALTSERDYAALLAQENAFAARESLDQFFFLRRFSRLLALKRISGFTEAAALYDEINARLGSKRNWLIGFFGAQTYTRFVVDASTALTRVGRYDAAREFVDDAVRRLNEPPSLLLHRAEMSWPYAPQDARADLATCAEAGAIGGGHVLLAAHLDQLAAGEAVDPDAFDTRLAEHPQTLLVAANAHLARGDVAGYAGRINGFFEAQGLRAPLPTRTARFPFEDPDAAEPLGATSDGPLVSVVMTTHDSAATVDYALRSILAQTHANLEIFVVDDCSSDDTRARLEALAAGDPRVTLMFNAENMGTYCSKNRAIAVATGEYVTLHDSDDWAHPERIARHVAMMEQTPTLAASRSEWLRVEAGGALHFRRWGCKFLHPNPASTFIRRDALDRVGYFDSVRYGADSEYWFRLNRVFGKGVKTLPLCLGFGYMRAASLTQSGSGAMDLENYAPSRGAYAANYLRWHASAAPEDLKLPPRVGARPFPTPPEMIVPSDEAPEPLATPPVVASPARLPADGPPEFMFGVSLASRQVSADWERTQELLGHTLRSLLNQSDPRFSVVICGHERPALAELDDPRVLFIESDQGPPKKPSGFRGDKMHKRRLAGLNLRERGGGYFFPLDADDLVHRDMVAHALRDDNRRGYLIDAGYVLDYENRVLAPVPGAWSVAFDRACGSSAAIYFEPEDLPVNGDLDEELYFNLFQSHAYWPIVAEEYARPLDRLPFAGGVYVVNHAQNLSFRLQRKGLRTENIVKSIARHRIEDAGDLLGAEFGLFLGERNQDTK